MPFGQAMRGAMGMGGGGGMSSAQIPYNGTPRTAMQQQGAMFGQNPGMGGGTQSPRPGNPYGQPQANTPFGGGMRQGPMAPQGRFGQQMGQMRGMLPQFMQQKMGQMGGQSMGPMYGQQQQMPQENPEAVQELQGQKPAMQGGEAPPWMQSMQGGMSPQQSKLQQMMQRWGGQGGYQPPAMVNNGWGKMIPREEAEAFRRSGAVA